MHHSGANRLFFAFVFTVTGLASFWALQITFFQEVLLCGDSEGEFFTTLLTDQEAVFKYGLSHLLLLERCRIFPRLIDSVFQPVAAPIGGVFSCSQEMIFFRDHLDKTGDQPPGFPKVVVR